MTGWICAGACGGGGNHPNVTTGGVTSELVKNSAVGIEDYHLSIGGDGTSLGWWTDLRAAKRWRNTPLEYLASAFFDCLGPPVVAHLVDSLPSSPTGSNPAAPESGRLLSPAHLQSQTI